VKTFSEKIHKREDLVIPKEEPLTEENKKLIKEAVERVLKDYGECIRKLGDS